MVDEPRAAPFAFDPEQTWHKSPLDRDAINRTLSAIGRLEAPSELIAEAWYLTLAELSGWFMSFAIQGKSAATKDVRATRAAFLRFIEALQLISNTPSAPPAPPMEWIEAMYKWELEQRAQPLAQGRSPNIFDTFAYPLLLAFYENLLGQKPAATVGGPTERFLAAYLSELHAACTAAAFATMDLKAEVLARLKPPSQSNLLMKIRNHRSQAKEKTGLVLLVFTKFGDTLSQREGFGAQARIH